jgi:hypothetical protein
MISCVSGEPDDARGHFRTANLRVVEDRRAERVLEDRRNVVSGPVFHKWVRLPERPC